ncbi:MAG: hypothetical protein IT204_25715 [Fimbriimonadaceae bacterium]|nr:hypothetical protein [Fimbriimonadaceae bacterium]
MTGHSGEITIKDVKHVMDLLVGSLYGHDPHLTVREMIQNAHDALAEAGGNLPPAQKSITVRVAALDRQPYLEIQDTGVGLTGPEMADRFGRIGDSEKLKRAVDHPELIGKFGIGFLSAFIVADHVEVLTKTQDGSHDPADGGYWLWKTEDQRAWQLTQLKPAEATAWTAGDPLNHGTRVRLYFRPSYALNADRVNDLKTVDGLEKIVRLYCYLLPFPIYVALGGDRGRVANLVRDPWQSEDLAGEAFKALFGKNPPFFTWRFEAKDPARGYSAAGVLYFCEQLNRTPSVQLYVKRMLVNAEDRQLIPPYGVMVSGLVECPQLEVDLARRQVAPFDPAYKWLRQQMLTQFEQAFLQMSDRRFEEFQGLWPRIDNSFIVHLMDAYHGEADEPLQAAAKSFLIRAGQRLPFYLVDTISGSQGRPLWRTIAEYATKRKQELTEDQLARRSNVTAEPVDEHGRIRVFFTASQGPVEKDLLIDQYKELFDVGRESQNHALVFKAIQGLGSEMPEVALVEVQASRFGEVAEGEAHRWREVRDYIQRLLVFSGRQHEVRVEAFEPVATPILITDLKIDEKQVTAMRDHLAGMGNVPGIGPQLLAFLDQMANQGGRLIIHVNTRNELMIRLLEAITGPSADERTAGQDALSLIAWRAVIDYFGWTSTRDMIARDREYTHSIIRNLLESRSEAVRLRTESDTNRASLDDLRSQRDAAVTKAQELADSRRQERETAEASQTVEAICCFIDMDGSTANLMANPHVAPGDRDRLLQWLAGQLATQIEACGGQVISFTGDGLLFLLTRAAAKPQAVWPALCGLGPHLAAAAGRDEKTHRDLAAMGVALPNLRLGLSSGQVFVGPVGPGRNAIGLGIVEAARIIAAKDHYQAQGTTLLASQQAYTHGAAWGFWNAPDLVVAGQVTGHGLPAPLNVYKPLN